ncbi:MAG: hypothetical protein H7X92_09340 [Chitinophagales bacterium]|nr:hypothetical protein [Hyphomicrobiales bacterium]
MNSAGNRLRIAFKLVSAAFYLARGRKMRKFIRGNQVVVPLVSPERNAAVNAPANNLAFPPVESLPHRMVRMAPIVRGRPVCLFVTHSGDGRVWPHVQAYVKRFRDAGVYTMLIAASDRSDMLVHDPGPDIADAVMVKRNGGYDFACWALALKLFPELWNVSAVYLANDSVYGPLDSFGSMMERIERLDADLIGLTESDDIAYHLQSYFLVMKPRALANRAIREFWQGVRNIESKHRVVKEYEVPLARLASNAGLRAEALFPLRTDGAVLINPTLFRWRELIEAGFPFMKAHLLRENLSRQDIGGWRGVFARRGGDVDLIALHLGGVNPRAPGLRTE